LPSTEDKGAPEQIGEILARVLKETGLLDRKKQDELQDAWRDVAGPQVAGHTSIYSLRSGVLTIGVHSAPLLQELEVFQREELLGALRERLRRPQVEDLRFRLL
jgi:predicted nucleic acid-binding Zn ribbon protein